MPYIMRCGTNKYLGTNAASRLAVVRSLGSALRFTTPMEGQRFIAKKANKNLKSRQWSSMQVDFCTKQMFPCLEGKEMNAADVVEDALQDDKEESVVTSVTQEKAELAPEYVRELLSSDFDVQAVVKSLNIIRNEFLKLDERHEKLNRALSLYDRAISDIMHAIEGSEEGGKDALVDDVIRVRQLRKLRKGRRIVKMQLLLYNELSPAVCVAMRKGILQENLLRYADGTQKVYNTRIMNYGVLMNSDSYVSRNLVSDMICDCMFEE